MTAGGQGTPQGMPEQPGMPGQPGGGPAPSGGQGPHGPAQPYGEAPQFGPAPGQPGYPAPQPGQVPQQPSQPPFAPGAAPATGAGQTAGGAAGTSAGGSAAAAAGIGGMGTGLLATIAGCLVAVLLAVAGLVVYLNQREPSGDGQVVADSDSDAGDQSGDSADGSDGGSDGGDGGTAADSAAHAGPAPDFQDGAYSVPSSCGTFALRYDDYDEGKGLSPIEATFSGGVAQGEGSGSPNVTVEEVLEPGAGGPAAVVHFSCYAGGSYSYGSLGIYDVERNLVAEVEPWSLDLNGTDDDPLSGRVYETPIDDLAAKGPDIAFTIPQIGVYGDTDCHACEGSATAELAYRWTGSGVEHTDSAFRVGDDLVRLPDADDVQAFVDAVVAGEDDAVRDQASDDFWQMLDSPDGDGLDPDHTVRKSDFSGPIEIGSCELIAAGADSYPYYMRDGVEIPVSVGGDFYPTRAGDVVCGAYQTDRSSSRSVYDIHMLLRGHEDGAIDVYGYGRNAG